VMFGVVEGGRRKSGVGHESVKCWLSLAALRGRLEADATSADPDR
jgi:hypothetical protein